MPFLKKSVLLEIRREMEKINDGSDDYKDLFKHYSWFLEKFWKFAKKTSMKDIKEVEEL